MEPPADCARCPRLVAYRASNRLAHPDDHNAPVPSAGPPDPALFIVGLAPGLRGANRTGVPFDGDRSGRALRLALERNGFTSADTRIGNAVRCVPPGNRPTAAEIAACHPFLAAEIASLPLGCPILALGRVAHAAVMAVCETTPTPFAHGRAHRIADGRLLVNCYHPSPLTMNTGRLTPAMLDAVLGELAQQRPIAIGGAIPAA